MVVEPVIVKKNCIVHVISYSLIMKNPVLLAL